MTEGEGVFLLHHTHEGRIGLCYEAEGQGLNEGQIIARLTFDQTVGLFDDIHETFTTCCDRGRTFIFGDEDDDD